MKTQFKKYKKWADRFNDEIIKILQEEYKTRNVKTADFQEDINFCTDFVINDNYFLSSRVRKQKYFQKYKDEITLRSKTLNGNETEIEKIFNGKGKDIFYAFSDEKEEKIFSWKILNIEVIRSYLESLFFLLKDDEKDNFDGSKFIPIKLKYINDRSLIKKENKK